MSALPLLLAALAAAAPVSGAVDDPVDGVGTPAQDIVHASSTFDSATGSSSLTLRMQAPVSAQDSARIHGILYREDPARPGVCPNDDTTGELGRFEADTDPNTDDASFGTTRAEKAISADGREVTLSVMTLQLAGATAVCAWATLSKNRPLDVLDRPIILQPGFTQPPASGGGDTPAATAPRIALAWSVVRVSHGVAELRLKPFTARTSVSVRGTAARGKRTVAPRQPATVRLKLTGAGRRLLARHRRARVRIEVSALQTGKPRASRGFTVTLKRS